MRIAALVFPRLTQLDLTGPYEVFSRVPGAEVMLVAKSLEPVRSEFGLPIVPNATFENAASFTLLFCPGGPGVNEAILGSSRREEPARLRAPRRRAFAVRALRQEWRAASYQELVSERLLQRHE